MNINESQYAALATFLRGYLHQDSEIEYGSPVAAARAFHKDADVGETTVVRSELDRLLSITAQLPFNELANALEKLGCNWRFRARIEVEEMRDALK